MRVVRSDRRVKGFTSVRICLPLFLSDYYRCQRCASPLPTVVPNESCSRCTTAKWRFTAVVTLGPGDSRRLREAVIQMKKKRHELSRRAVGELMAEQLLVRFGESSPLLLPVPNHWTRNFVRSVCQASSLCSRFLPRPAGQYYRMQSDALERRPNREC